jgi:hypothetical protein
MKILITTIALISINLSGCVVPFIVKDITDNVLEEKAIHLEQKQSVLARVKSYIAARNANNKVLINSMTTVELNSEKKSSARTVKLIDKPILLVKENIAVVWASFTSINDSNDSHCGTSSFQLIKETNDWKIAHVTWSLAQTGCELSA